MQIALFAGHSCQNNRLKDTKTLHMVSRNILRGVPRSRWPSLIMASLKRNTSHASLTQTNEISIKCALLLQYVTSHRPMTVKCFNVAIPGHAEAILDMSRLQWPF